MDSGKKWTSGGIWVPDSEANFKPKIIFHGIDPQNKDSNSSFDRV